MTQLPILQKFLIVIKNTNFNVDFLDDRIHYYENNYDMMDLYKFMRRIINTYSDTFSFYEFQSEQFEVNFDFDEENIILKCKLSSYDKKYFEIKYSYDDFTELFLENKIFSQQVNISFNNHVRLSFEIFLKEELDKKFQQFSDRFIFEKLKDLHN